MMKPEKGSHEVVLESRHLLGVFFLAVVLAAFFFSMGYFLGRSQASADRASAPPPAKPAKDSGGPPPTDLTFYERVESRPRAERPAPPQPAPAAPTAAAAAESEPVVHLQVAAVSQESEAKRLAKKLVVLGFPAVVRPPQGDRLYRVQVGPFDSTELADAAARRLQAQGFTDIVRR
ncbi:MAG: SPOR domain-containing protein [Candidatus Acidiferrales bacterium]